MRAKPVNETPAVNSLSQHDTLDRSDPELLLDRIEELTSQVQTNDRNERIQRAVFEIASTSTTAECMETLYQAIHKVVAELTSIDAIFIALYHESEDCLSFPYYVDHYDDSEQEAESPLKTRGKIPLEQCVGMLTWQGITTNEVVRSKADGGPRINSFGRESQDWLVVPLRRNGRPIGVFSIQSYQHGFEYRDEEVDLMVFISQHIASALQHVNNRESICAANEDLKASAAKLAETNAQLKAEIKEREIVNQRLIELSHQAGKAEIATGILHNVGNVLNSINVSAGVAKETLRTSRIESLVKAANLFVEQDDPGDFLTNDKRGKAFPQFLCSLADVLVEEREKIKSELSMLGHHLDHVKTVVSMQQAYAGMSGLRKPVNIPDLLSDAELLIASSLSRHEVEVVRNFDPIPTVMLEEQRLLQVIVNLLKNAKDSVTVGRAEGRKLVIGVSRDAEGMLLFEFTDNGEGITEDNLTNVFTHGFTTKSDGHGFGLHSCAIAMKEMGGEITVSSEGAGTGATFTLRLPCVEAENDIL